MLAKPSPQWARTDHTDHTDQTYQADKADQTDFDQGSFWNEGRFGKNVNWPPIFQPSCSRLKFVNLRQLKMLALVIPSANKNYLLQGKPLGKPPAKNGQCSRIFTAVDPLGSLRRYSLCPAHYRIVRA